MLAAFVILSALLAVGAGYAATLHPGSPGQGTWEIVFLGSILVFMTLFVTLLGKKAAASVWETGEKEEAARTRAGGAGAAASGRDSPGLHRNGAARSREE